jgi:AraC-like DNA-binding protein
MQDDAPGAARTWGTVYLWPPGSLLVGGDVHNELHRHYTAAVHIALDAPFGVRFGAGPWLRRRGVVVAPNVEQQMDARGCSLVILQLDPELEPYARVATRLAGQRMMDLDDALSESIASDARTLLASERFDPVALWELVVGRVELSDAQLKKRDPRIQQVIDRLKQRPSSPPVAAELAQGVGLSEGRLIHLFTEEMGLPMRRYVLWLRLREAIFTLAEGGSLTEAAHAAGFSDSPHFSRTFRGMFGMQPSALLKDSRTLKVEIMMPSDATHAERVSPIDAERWLRIAELRGGAT